MAKGEVINEIRAWRTARGLSMEDAAGLIVVDGKPTNRATWHAWEWGRKAPGRRHMPVFRSITGLSADIFHQPAENDATALIPQVA